MSDTNDKRRVPAGELSHICAWSDEKLVKLREYKLALDLRDSRAECERWRELHNIKEACREHAEQELAALRDAARVELEADRLLRLKYSALDECYNEKREEGE
jgi:hypothetical protein